MSFRKISVLTVLMTLFSTSLSATRPNIILIVADDLGYNDVGFHGSDQIPTPNIDFLAYNGILLNNYYVSPICTPTRAALLTGRHPVHTGMQHDVIIGDQAYGLPLNETLMSQYLNTLGYESHIVGKWHLGMLSWDYTPLYRGFKSHIGYYQGCEDYYDHTYEANLSQWGLDFRRDKDLLWNYTGKYSTDIFRDEAVKVIQNHNQAKPLFLYLPFQAVHSSNANGPHLQAPKEYIDKFKYIENKQRRIYAAMVSALDDAVGTVYDTLESTGLLSNSIIVFTTDNGGPANGFDFNAANNFPLRGVKATLWEGGVRGVGFINSPLLKQRGYVANQMLHVCDWLPTLYSAAGGNVTDLKNLDGFDSWNMLSENGPAVRDEILHNIDPLEKKAAIRVGEYKLVAGHLSHSWGGWYPPWKLHGDEHVLHYLNFKDRQDFVESEEKSKLRHELDSNYRKYWPTDVNDRLQQLNSYNIPNAYPQIDSEMGAKISPWSQKDAHFDLYFKSESLVNNERSKGIDDNVHHPKRLYHQKHIPRGSPVKIDCGVKPLNASTNCKPTHAPCLYKITQDPCEYYNIAQENPEIVASLLKRLGAWTMTMVKPRNKPGDDAGNPKYHGGAWVPWR